MFKDKQLQERVDNLEVLVVSLMQQLNESKQTKETTRNPIGFKHYN